MGSGKKISYIRELEEEEIRFTEEDRKEIEDAVDGFRWFERAPQEDLYHYKIRMSYAWWKTNQYMRMANWDWENEVAVRTYHRQLVLPRPPHHPVKETTPQHPFQMNPDAPVRKRGARMSTIDPTKITIKPSNYRNLGKGIMVEEGTSRNRVDGPYQARGVVIRDTREEHKRKITKLEPEPKDEESEPEEELEEEEEGSN